MACRAALLAVLPSTGSALAVHKASLRDVGLHDATEAMDMERMLMPAESNCQAAQEGSDCFKSVEYLRSQGFKTHPTWYPGYTSESSFEEVQDMLHGLEKAKCPKPCFAQFAQVSPRIYQAASVAKFDCRDTIEGDVCYSSVAWLKEVGFELHPDWYPGLDNSSSTASIQAELHRKGKSDCSLPCSATEAAQEKAKAHMEMAMQTQEMDNNDCLDATPGTQCYNDVSFGMAEGIRKHPQFYEGLKESSNFKEIQEYLYLNNRSLCERPCPAKKMSLDMMVNNYEDMREKKRIQDMSTDELTRYLNGEWDGYVAKVFRSQDDHFEFEKRKYNPTVAPRPVEAADDIESEKPANDDAEVADHSTEATSIIKHVEVMTPADDAAATSPEKTADDATHKEEAVDSTEAQKQAEAEAEAKFKSAEADAETQLKAEAEAKLKAEAEAKLKAEAEAARLAKEAAEAADAIEKPFPETEMIPSTDEARELLVCLLKLRDVTAETFGDIKGECEEKLPLEGDDRAELAKESMRFFMWAQRHVQFQKSKQKAEAEAAKAEEPKAEEPKAEEPKAEEPKAEEANAKDQDVVDEPMPEIDSSSLGETEVAVPEKHAETPEEMEQRLREQLMQELKAQTTTIAPHKETEEEMRERVKAEIMRELAMAKPASA